MDKKLKILKVIDVYGWAWHFVVLSQQKYSKHTIVYQRLNNFNIKLLKDVDIVYFHCPFKNDLVIDIKKNYPSIKIIGGYGGEHEITYPNCIDLIVTMSTHFLPYLTNLYTYKPVIFLPQGVDTSLFTPGQIPVNFTPGFAGSNYPVKRTHILDQLKYPIKKQQEHGQVYYKENRSRQPMIDFYHSISCLVMCSEREGLSNVTLEAMACGLPVISTDVGSMRLLLSNNYLVPANPEPIVIEQINKKLDLLSNNRQLIYFRGKENREHVLKYFDWKIIQPLWDKLFEYLVKNEYNEIIKLSQNYCEPFIIKEPNLKLIGKKTPKVEDLSEKLTVFVLSCENNPNYNNCLEALEKQTVGFRRENIKDITPMSEAFSKMILRCTTPYYIQCDEDMILNPDTIEKMYKEIIKTPNDVFCLCFKLHDRHLNKSIDGVKIYKHQIVKQFKYHDEKKGILEEDLSAEFHKRITITGYKLIRFQDVVGEHAPLWTPEAIYNRYQKLQIKEKFYKSDRGYGDLEQRFYERLSKNPNEEDLIALLGSLSPKYFNNISYKTLISIFSKSVLEKFEIKESNPQKIIIKTEEIIVKKKEEPVTAEIIIKPSKIKVVQLASIPCANSGFELSNLINEYSKDYESRYILFNEYNESDSIRPKRVFPFDLFWQTQSEECLKIINNANIIHIHHNILWDKKVLNIIKFKPIVVTWYNLINSLKYSNNEKNQIFNKNLLELTKNHTIIDQPLQKIMFDYIGNNYVPLIKYLFKENTKKSNHIPVIVYAPTTRIDDEIGTKKYTEVLRIIEELHKEKVRFTFDLIEGVPYEENLERKRKADILIDDVDPRYEKYHNSSIEAACFGAISLTNYTGEDYPFIKTNIFQLKKELKWFISQPKELKKEQTKIVKWRETFYTPERLLIPYEELYKKVKNNE